MLKRSRRNRLWLANNRHIFKQKREMNHQPIDFLHNDYKLAAFLMADPTKVKKRKLMTAKQFKKKKLDEVLEKQANGGDVEVDDKHYLSIIELREQEIERQ